MRKSGTSKQNQNQNQNQEQGTEFNFIDLFAGAGGLSCGLEEAGHRCLLGVDFNKRAMETFAANHPHAATFCGDIKKLTNKKIKEFTGGKEIHLVVGGPPCQGFSTVGRGNPKDDRNHLFLEFVRVVRDEKPNFIILENVTGLLAQKNGKTLSAILDQFQKLGYTLSVQMVSMELYGVPERRRRTIIIGSLIHKVPVPFPEPTHAKPVTVGEAFKNLNTKEGTIFNHDISKAQIVSEIDKKRLKHIPEGKGIRYEEDEKSYLPAQLRFDVDWETLREHRFRQTQLQRLDRSLPSPTIMTSGRSYYHPTENRYLTVREAAKLQGFPNHFIFKGPVTSQWRQIGNAVPPILGKVLGEHLKKLYLDRNKKVEKDLSLTDQVHIIRSQAFRYHATNLSK